MSFKKKFGLAKKGFNALTEDFNTSYSIHRAGRIVDQHFAHAFPPNTITYTGPTLTEVGFKHPRSEFKTRDYPSKRQKRSLADHKHNQHTFRRSGDLVPTVGPTSSRRKKYPYMSKRRYSRKRGRYGNASSIARKALSKVRKLEKKQEVKMFDINLTTIVTIGTAGDIRSLALIAQGDGRDARDGNAISPFFLNLKYQWQGVAASTLDMYRTLIVRDLRQIASTVPAVLDVLQEAHPLSQLRFDTRKRFKILYDMTYTAPNDATVALSYSASVKMQLKKTMTFSGAASTTIETNGLFMINLSNLAANQPQFRFTSRTFYNDN